MPAGSQELPVDRHSANRVAAKLLLAEKPTETPPLGPLAGSCAADARSG